MSIGIGFQISFLSSFSRTTHSTSNDKCFDKLLMVHVQWPGYTSQLLRCVCVYAMPSSFARYDRITSAATKYSCCCPTNDSWPFLNGSPKKALAASHRLIRHLKRAWGKKSWAESVISSISVFRYIIVTQLHIIFRERKPLFSNSCIIPVTWDKFQSSHSALWRI